MGLLIFASGISLGLALVTILIAYSRSGAKGVIWFSLIMAVISSLLVMPTVLVQEVGTLMLAIIFRVVRARPRTVAIGSAIVAGSVLAGLAAIGITSLCEANRLRLAYPVVSVDDRLAYERSARLDPARPGGPEGPPVQLSANAENRLDVEDRYAGFRNSGFARRQVALKRLHTQSSEAFVDVNEVFGASRMRQVPLRAVELPEQPSIPLPAATPPTVTASPGDALAGGPQPAGGLRSAPPQRPAEPQLAPGPEPESTVPSDDSLLALHDGGTADFLDRDRIGYVASRRQVAGLVPHRFTRLPVGYHTNGVGWIRDDAIMGPATSKWQVTRLELVSLLKYPEPRVYVSRDLPRMDELGKAVTRPLSDFEAGALLRLRDGEDLVVDSAPSHIHMLGSLRASKSCIECHDVGRGALLGAFSYDLDRQPPGAVTPQRRPGEL